MREILAEHIGDKLYFIGKIGRKGIGLGYRNDKVQHVETLVINDIYDLDGNYITDHVWIKCSRPFINLEVDTGGTIKFRAVVKTYIRRSNGKREIDYGLCYMSKVEVI